MDIYATGASEVSAIVNNNHSRLARWFHFPPILYWCKLWLRSFLADWPEPYNSHAVSHVLRTSFNCSNTLGNTAHLAGFASRGSNFPKLCGSGISHNHHLVYGGIVSNSQIPFLLQRCPTQQNRCGVPTPSGAAHLRKQM